MELYVLVSNQEQKISWSFLLNCIQHFIERTSIFPSCGPDCGHANVHVQVELQQIST